MKNIFGLLGKNISYSFSKKYFTNKFTVEKLPFIYKNFDIDSIEELPIVLNDAIKNLKGFNVTIPYKETIFKYLDEVDLVAEKIGAVNTVKIVDENYLKGYNTDYYGFLNSLNSILKPHHKFAVILGNGGATKAIKYALKKMKIDFIIVSRNPNGDNQIAYDKLTKAHLLNSIVINCTPLGTHPNIKDCPNIPYKFIGKNNLLYDLVYNPLETEFLKRGKLNGAITKNGLEMLGLQAEKSWKIWNDATEK